MNKEKTLYASERWSYIFTLIALNAGFVLSVIAWMQICTSECTESHNYKLFRLPFELYGVVYFGILSFLHMRAYRQHHLHQWIGLMLMAGLGSEAWFIYIQKHSIGTWCPVCLGICACIITALISYGRAFIQIERKQNEEYMKRLKNRAFAFTALLFGFLSAFVGVSKINPLEAAEESIKKDLYFGTASSPIEVYFFTDWFCPACRSVEPAIEKLAPQIMKQAKLVFVDYALHPESLNFSPYNLSFIVNNKPKYFELRTALTKLAQETETPTEAQVEKLATTHGITFHQLNYSDVKLALEYFEQLGSKYKINNTPVMIIINKNAKKGIKLHGADEITEAKIKTALESALKEG